MDDKLEKRRSVKRVANMSADQLQKERARQRLKSKLKRQKDKANSNQLEKERARHQEKFVHCTLTESIQMSRKVCTLMESIQMSRKVCTDGINTNVENKYYPSIYKKRLKQTSPKSGARERSAELNSFRRKDFVCGFSQGQTTYVN